MDKFAIYAEKGTKMTLLGTHDFKPFIDLTTVKKVLMDEFWDERLNSADTSPVIRKVRE